MRKDRYYELLASAEERLREALGLAPDETIPVALVLGTGWADAFPLKVDHSVAMQDLVGTDDDNPFVHVDSLDGHARRYEIGKVNGHRVLVLRGRVHMNEFVFNPAGKLAVRMQIELLIKLGAKTLILTTGVGSLKPEIEVGSVVFFDGWVSSSGEETPLYLGEFKDSEGTIRTTTVGELTTVTHTGFEDLSLHVGGHVYWHGPHFEGRAYDKKRMADAGGSCVSMSVKPECAVVALYDDVQTIPMGFVCNSPFEPMDHEHHRNVARAAAPKLGALLECLIEMVDC
ncbi:MAG: hypothetical protein AAB431_01925 [Patescibacteria group bacterium]